METIAYILVMFIGYLLYYGAILYIAMYLTSRHKFKTFYSKLVSVLIYMFIVNLLLCINTLLIGSLAYIF